MSQAKIYVGNLPYNITEDELRDFFAPHGSVEEVKLIMDFNTGRSKGFGFITFATEQASEAAIQGANGAELGGRKLKVNKAQEGGSRGGRGGRGNGGGRHFRGPRDNDNFGNRADDRY